MFSILAMMVRKIRKALTDYFIYAETKKAKRERKVINLNDAQNVGILFYLDDEKKYRTVEKLINSLDEQKKKVKAIGYVPSKRYPNYYMAKLKIDVITKKNLNLYGIPKGGFVKEFINSDFDILLDINTGKYYPLIFLAGASRAKFKVGMYDKELVKIFDFMIYKKEDMSFDDFTDSMLYYLTVINK